MNALQRDVSFLKSHQLMDYSLLVEVERSDASHYHKRFHNRIVDPVSTSMKDRYDLFIVRNRMGIVCLRLLLTHRGKLAVLGSDGRIYHFGIIDFLQK
mmetsp:Transcript_1445/g.1984  ORF Transcript_1445/g.1984 Transcript_1445/m.1984 type:complete len:98 (-) Transcript_1445:1161-1454(-)